MGVGNAAVKGGLGLLGPIGWGLLAADAIGGEDYTGQAGKALDEWTGSPADPNAGVDPGRTFFDGQAPVYGSGMGKAGNFGMDQAYGSNKTAGEYVDRSLEYRDPQAVENQQLSDNEAYSRGYDQQGAIQLAREAAMGQAPSEAAYMMQAGLDRGLANQQAIAGGARGAGGIALAGGQSAGNAAAMQNQAYTAAGQMRAGEMNAARGLYGGLAGTMREQDQSRLKLGNDMSTYNAGANDNYQLGMGQLGIGQTNSGINAYGQATNAYGQKYGVDANIYGTQAGVYKTDQDNAYGNKKSELDRRQQDADRNLRGAGMAVDTVGKIVSGAK